MKELASQVVAGLGGYAAASLFCVVMTYGDLMRAGHRIQLWTAAGAAAIALVLAGILLCDQPPSSRSDFGQGPL